MILREKVTKQIGFQWYRKTSAKVFTKMLGKWGEGDARYVT